MSAVKSNVRITQGAVVCEETELVGDITIGSRTVIHPKAKIIAKDGPIVIGDNNIIEELVQIVNRNPEGGAGATHKVMIIGNNNVFEVGAVVESLKVGDNNVVEAKASVGRHVDLTSNCIVGAMCQLTGQETLPENTLICGSQYDRSIGKEKPPSQHLQIDFLNKILPNYHYIRKAKPAGGHNP